MSQALAAPAPGTEPLSRNHRRLDAAARRTLAALAAERLRCPGCRARDFAVGDALEMGSIWPGEQLGTYMIALICRACGAHTGMRTPVPGDHRGH